MRVLQDGTGRVISSDGTETILEEAQRLVYGPREEGYGHPRDNMQRIANIWSVILEKEITPRQVALCMAGVKLARDVHEQDRENLVDLAGYAAVADRCSR